jgi:hypothetical protein
VAHENDGVLRLQQVLVPKLVAVRLAMFSRVRYVADILHFQLLKYQMSFHFELTVKNALLFSFVHLRLQ